MLIAVIPLIVLIIGVLIWVLSSNTYLKEIGRWMFIIGLLCTVWPTMNQTHKLF